MKRRDFMKTAVIGVTATGMLPRFSAAGERHKEVDENMTGVNFEKIIVGLFQIFFPF